MLVPAVLAAIALAGCSGAETSSFGSKGTVPQASVQQKVKVVDPAEREPAPEVKGTTLEGKTLTLDSYEGKVVLLNFWGSWCGPCRDEAPALRKVANKSHDQGVRVVGVDVLDNKASAKAFVRNFNLNYPSIYDQPSKIALKFRDTIPPQAIPSTILIDRKGRVAGRIIGEAHYDQLMSLVQRVGGGSS